MRRVLAKVQSALPYAIPICFLLIPMLEFYRQNRTTFSRQGDFRLTTEDELNTGYGHHVAEDDDPIADQRASTTNTAPVVARKYLLKRRAGLMYGERGDCAMFEAMVPEFPFDSPFFRHLNNQLRSESMQLAREFAVWNWSSIYDGFRDPSYSAHHFDKSIGVEIVHRSRLSVSLLEHHWEYTGGAHGNSYLYGRCFIERQGEVHQLTLPELFDPQTDWSQKLITHCLGELHSQGASRVPEECLTDASISPIAIDDLSQFTLSPAGLRCYFSPYHVGCYAEGIYTAAVPYSVIQDCLPSNSPARLFMTAAQE